MHWLQRKKPPLSAKPLVPALPPSLDMTSAPSEYSSSCTCDDHKEEIPQLDGQQMSPPLPSDLASPAAALCGCSGCAHSPNLPYSKGIGIGIGIGVGEVWWMAASSAALSRRWRPLTLTPQTIPRPCPARPRALRPCPPGHLREGAFGGTTPTM